MQRPILIPPNDSLESLARKVYPYLALGTTFSAACFAYELMHPSVYPKLFSQVMFSLAVAFTIVLLSIRAFEVFVKKYESMHGLYCPHGKDPMVCDKC